MAERAYRIQMQTPMGTKHGVLKAITGHGNLHGYLDVMDHAEPFCGTIDEEGHCRFTGTMITLMRTIAYEAFGIMDTESVTLTISDERNVFRLEGNAFLMEADSKGEQIK